MRVRYIFLILHKMERVLLNLSALLLQGLQSLHLVLIALDLLVCVV